jgi:hypothetical protein
MFGSHPLDRRTGRERRSYAEQSFRLHRFKHGGTRPTRLREYLGLTGTKFGCGIGMCSAQLETGNVSAPFSPFSLSRLKSE